MSIRYGCLGVAALAAGVGWLGYSREEPTRLTFLAVGQGDCALFRHRDRTILVDAGPETTRPLLLAHLRRLGVSRVDLLILTHPDLDHLGGADVILAAYPNAQVAISEAFRPNPEMQAHLRQWRLAEWRVLWLPEEAQMTVGDARLRLHAPPLKNGEAANAGSVFLRIQTGRAAATLTGDAPRQRELAALRIDDWSAQLLKAGHHGSRTSTDPAFLRAVRPDWLIVSCARDNPYGHPARETLATADHQKVKIARTDLEGDLAFEIREGRFVRVNP